ncbi:MAG: IS1 family transposase [Gammaproteobacteria bacterium]|nr:IS1 family transposase [Gammaproteobacteria bacterium]
MTFLSDLWKKFNTPVSSDNDVAVTKKNTLTTEAKKSALNTYVEAETEYLQSNDILEHLIALKARMAEPKEEKPDLRATEIKEIVGIAESFETVRQERWHSNIQCPNCNSINLKRLAQLPSQSPHNHRYRCLECLFEFNDDSGTPLEAGEPPINIWMQCWYLMGCTDSLTYIAAKLNLDLTTIERMAQQLKRIFNAQKPLTHFLGFDTWRKQSEEQFKQLKEDLTKQYELLDANVAITPKDSTEFRRQQNLRRTIEPTLDPTAGTGARGPGKKRT